MVRQRASNRLTREIDISSETPVSRLGEGFLDFSRRLPMRTCGSSYSSLRISTKRYSCDAIAFEGTSYKGGNDCIAARVVRERGRGKGNVLILFSYELLYM